MFSYFAQPAPLGKAAHLGLVYPCKVYRLFTPLVSMDIVSPFPENEAGSKYILVVSDYFTKWVEAYGIANLEATTITQTLVDELSILCKSVIDYCDLHERQFLWFTYMITISIQIESHGVVELSCEYGSCSVTSTRWDAEGGPLVDRVECQCDSVWVVLVGYWSPTA